MTTTLAIPDAPRLNAEALENVLIKGDLSKLSEEQRVAYYRSVCESLGLNPLTQPFDYITLNGKLRFYAKKDATDQLRKLHGVSITQIEKTFHDDLYIVTAYASDRMGRTDASTGAVMIKGLKGEALANALMKAETKAKRRVTLSICGLGILDELEAEDVNKPTIAVEPQTKVIDGKTVNTLSGEVVDDDGKLRIAKVEILPTTTGRQCWKLILSDGREAFEFREPRATLAQQCAQFSEPVIVETKDSTRGLDVVSLARAVTPEPAPAPEPPNTVTADMIPF